jgi:hypothetical protein
VTSFIFEQPHLILFSQVRRKMEARIDWGDWSLLAMALMMGQHADDVSGMANITPLWPAILHRLIHPCKA